MFGLWVERGVLLAISATKPRTFSFVNIIQPDPWAVLSNPEARAKHLNSSNNIFTQVPRVFV